VKKRLIKFINKHHSDSNYLFWPDLASAHYAKDTIETFDQLGIKYVHKEENPPNVPQLRRIERFWAYLKAKVYANNWTAKTPEELIKKVKKELKTFTLNYCQTLLANTKTLVRKAADYGPLSVIN
jgi:transposase